MRISDWRDVCSSDLPLPSSVALVSDRRSRFSPSFFLGCQKILVAGLRAEGGVMNQLSASGATFCRWSIAPCVAATGFVAPTSSGFLQRSEEHTSELQSLMRISYAVFCLKKKKKNR